MTSNILFFRSFYFLQRWIFFFANRFAIGTSRLKMATFGSISWIRYFTTQYFYFISEFRMWFWRCIKKCFSIGMLRIFEYVFYVCSRLLVENKVRELSKQLRGTARIRPGYFLSKSEHRRPKINRKTMFHEQVFMSR